MAGEAAGEGDAVSPQSASRLDVMQSKLVQLSLALAAAWAAPLAESLLGAGSESLLGLFL